MWSSFECRLKHQDIALESTYTRSMEIVLSSPRRGKDSGPCEFERPALESEVLHHWSDAYAEKAALEAEAKPDRTLSSLPSRMDHFNFEDEFFKSRITYVCTTGPRKQTSTRVTGRHVAFRKPNTDDDRDKARNVRNGECQMQAWYAYLRGIDGYWRQEQVI